jgi:hypothetical protein
MSKPAPKAKSETPAKTSSAFLAEHADTLEIIAKTIERFQGTAILKIAACLSEARDLFRYRRDEGGFAGWVESRLTFSRQTAYNLIHVHEQFGGECVKRLDSFPTSVLYLLAAPSTPQAVRDEVISGAKAGEKPKIADVKAKVGAGKGHGRMPTTETKMGAPLGPAALASLADTSKLLRAMQAQEAQKMPGDIEPDDDPEAAPPAGRVVGDMRTIFNFATWLAQENFPAATAIADAVPECQRREFAEVVRAISEFMSALSRALSFCELPPELRSALDTPPR